MRTEGQAHASPRASLDLSRSFMPEALAGVAPLSVLAADDRRALNRIRAASYLHLFDVFETSLSSAVRALAAREADANATLAPLLQPDTFDHNELFREFEGDLARTFATPVGRVARPHDLDLSLARASALGLVVLALHLKLVTQQHYLACVRGDEGLEPRFVRLLKQHWEVERGGRPPSMALQQTLSSASQSQIPSALADYRRLVLVCDDVLTRQSRLDVATLESVRGARFPAAERDAILAAEIAAHRKAFLTIGIVNAAFVYAMRSLGPSAAAALAGVVSALSSRALEGTPSL